MVCEFMYYNKEETYYPRLKCKATDGGNCLYSKKCAIQEKFIPLDNEAYKECYIMIENREKNIPNGSYYIQTYRPNIKGNLYLYVVINNKVEKIATQLTEINQDYIYLKEGSEGYQVSLTPFVEKKNNTKKSKSENK